MCHNDQKAGRMHSSPWSDRQRWSRQHQGPEPAFQRLCETQPSSVKQYVAWSESPAMRLQWRVYIVVPSQCYWLWWKPRGSWRAGVHYSEEYILFAQRAAMHHNEQHTSSPLMRTVQPENCTTPRADTRKPALFILADSDHRSLKILPVCQILHQNGTPGLML